MTNSENQPENQPKITLEMLTAFFEDMLKEDPIDFGMIPVSEDYARDLMISHVFETYLHNSSDSNKELIYLGVIGRLLVENFVLNTEKLINIKNNRG